MVALAAEGRVEAAAGFADVATGESLTVEHRFRIGSVTKIFVAALVLQLVAEGLLDLDGDAAPFVEGVTIRQLLNHTSGLDDFVGDPRRSSSPIAGIRPAAGSSGRAMNFGWSWRSRASSRPARGGRITAATTSS